MDATSGRIEVKVARIHTIRWYLERDVEASPKIRMKKGCNSNNKRAVNR
jgi:hypothetical protein